jgi:ubiquitin-protein ligase
MTTVITKCTISRLLNDVKELVIRPLHDNGIYYQHDEDDILKGYAMIVGPEDTPYFGGYYFFEITYPADYPFAPPLVIYKTNGDHIRFNPNLYMNGKVCLSILNTWRGDQWTSCQTISTVLLNLCMVLCKEPFLNEPGIFQNYCHYDNYTKCIEYKNIDLAILKMMNKQPDIFPESCNIFYDIMQEHFAKNKSKILGFLEERKLRPAEKLSVNLYKMNVIIDYGKLHNLFQAYINKIELNNLNSKSII